MNSTWYGFYKRRKRAFVLVHSFRDCRKYSRSDKIRLMKAYKAKKLVCQTHIKGKPFCGGKVYGMDIRRRAFVIRKDKLRLLKEK